MKWCVRTDERVHLRSRLVCLLTLTAVVWAPLGYRVLGQEAGDWREVADRFFRSRSAGALVLGGSEVTVDGQFRWRDRGAEASVFKIPWQIDWNETEPLPLGETGLGWSIVWQGAGGLVHGSDELAGTRLAGNRTLFDTVAVGTGIGTRIWLTKWLTVMASVDGIYGYVEGTFEVNNEQGMTVLRELGMDKSEWDAHMVTISPGCEFRLRNWFGPVKLQYRLQFTWFRSIRLSRSAPVSSFESGSGLLINEGEIEVRTPLTIWNMPIHGAATFSRTELFDDLSRAFLCDHYYSVGGRFGPNVYGKLWHVSFIGPTGAYIWSPSFDGWTVGVQVDLLF